MPPDEHAAVSMLRRALADLNPQQAIELLLAKAHETSANAEILVQRSAPRRAYA
jgi:transcription termination factor Rho